MTPTEIQGYLHRHIPVSAAMEVRVVAADEAGVRLAAPLAPNINHRHTVFGGSASALAILAAWTLVHVGLRSEAPGSRIVIQRNAVEYLLPIEGDFEAFCPAPTPQHWQRLLAMLERRGRGRIELTAELLQGGRVAGRFSGTYVALRPPDEQP